MDITKSNFLRAINHNLVTILASEKSLAPKLILACSGGADSLAMTEALTIIFPQSSLFVVHINHSIRAIAAQQDADLVEKFCAMRNLNCIVIEVNVPDFAKQNKLSLEEAARILRYRELLKVLDTEQADYIVTGHNKDDQAETLLINLLRGSGLAGLSAMKMCSGKIIRPLLNISRVAIEDFCLERSIVYALDQTNYDTKYLRNKIRYELLPLLGQEYNPSIVDTLTRTTNLICIDDDYLKSQAEKFFQEHAFVENSCVTFSTDIASLHQAVLTRIVFIAIDVVMGERKSINYSHIIAILELFGKPTGKFLQLPKGLRVEKKYRKIIFYKEYRQK